MGPMGTARNPICVIGLFRTKAIAQKYHLICRAELAEVALSKRIRSTIMGNLQNKVAAFAGIGLGLFVTACGSSGTVTVPPPTTYVLTVNSTNPATGVSIGATPQDNN